MINGHRRCHPLDPPPDYGRVPLKKIPFAKAQALRNADLVYVEALLEAEDPTFEHLCSACRIELGWSRYWWLHAPLRAERETYLDTYMRLAEILDKWKPDWATEGVEDVQ
jgi:hypothetical protein